MGKKIVCTVTALSSWVFFLAGLGSAGELQSLFSQVENLNIQRHGYVLAAKLTQSQLAIAAENPMAAFSQQVFKFRDKGLNIVADKKTNRVLVIYEQFENLSQQKVQAMVGELFMAYDDPTISAHDKVVYWAWGKKGKFTAAQFDMAKENKTAPAVIATVKFNSEIQIRDKKAADAIGTAYYIISSDLLLRFFQKT
ncbi:MAG: hypothetical protein KKC20_15545 [Proteobacteria bacterium]|nr:hypothetical protein [Pseudomonadota bacterium]